MPSSEINKNDPDRPDWPRSERAPLQSKTILVTRARAQSLEITEQLEALGATVIHCPTIEIVAPTSWAPLDASIGNLQKYDWLVFTSANGATFFFNRLNQKRLDGCQALARHVICAIGPATARAVEAAGQVAHLTSSDSRGEGALAAIVDYLGGDENIRGLRFLIPRARVAREILPAGLRSLGAHVDAVETYQTVKPDVDAGSIIRLLKENPIDAITFTSSSTVSNFSELVGLTDLSDLLGGMLAACIGPLTAEAAANHGLKRIVQPKVYNAADLVKSIVKSIGHG